MYTTQEHISADGLRVLSRCVGRDVSFYTSQAEIEPDFVQIQDLSIRLGNSDFICLYWDWYDTQICAIDVFSLNIAEGEKPRLIEYEDQVLMGASSIAVRTPNKVRAVHILECFDEDEIINGADIGHIDSVNFDCGLVFEMETPPSIAFGAQGSIQGAMPVTYIPGWRFREYMREHNVRVSLEETSSIKGKILSRFGRKK